MTAREDASALVQQMQECFNTRQFDQADDLFTPGFFSHPLGTTGFEAGKDAWRKLTARFPGIRVVAEDILVDGDKVAVRSSVEGTGTPDGGPQPDAVRDLPHRRRPARGDVGGQHRIPARRQPGGLAQPVLRTSLRPAGLAGGA